MRLFISSLNADSGITPSPFPIADDGYLYVYAMGQSNMAGKYPEQLTDPWQGDKTNPTNVYVPDRLGGWILAEYSVWPFQVNVNNIAITMCRELADKYGLQIRMYFDARGGAALNEWIATNPDEDMWTRLVNIMNTFVVDGEFNNNYRPASTWIQHQGESGYGGVESGFASYQECWEAIRQQLWDAGYLVNDFYYLNGEFADWDVYTGKSNEQHTISALLGLKGDTVRSSGLERGEDIHFLGSGLEEFGLRYMRKYEELMGLLTPLDDSVLPTSTDCTASAIGSDSFTLSWDASTPKSGLTIEKYVIYSINGWVKYGEVPGNVLSTTVNFTGYSSSINIYNTIPIENCIALAVDSEGNFAKYFEVNSVNVTPI